MYADQPAVISLQGVSKSYATPAGPFRALREIDLDVRAGELVTLVGRSGSGKSTLLNVIGGIDRASGGALTVAGAALPDMSETQLAIWRGRTLGFVFQSFQLMPTLTAVENVMLPMDFARTLPGPQRRPRARHLLDQVGIADQADKLPATLSGGQQQRVAIARSLANQPAIVLADEPTGNLDSLTGRAILELLRALASAGTTVVLATHEHDLDDLVDRTVRLEDGAIVRSLASESGHRERERAR